MIFIAGFCIGVICWEAFNRYVMPKIKEKIKGWIG